MKGISHFTSAIAAATFIPGVVQAAQNEQSLLLVLAGVFGLLPDTLDFKFARYFEPPDEVVELDRLSRDVQAVADKTAEALNRAFETNEPIHFQLATLRLGPDRWQQYTVKFDNEANEVVVGLGPVVTGGQVPLGLPPETPPARAKVAPRLNYTYDGAMKIDIFEGPTFEFRRNGEAVEVSFLPWHRRWSHSLTLAAVLGLLCWLIFHEPLAGWVAAVGFATHVLEDQLGHIGSNLFWPFTTRRSAGLKLMHSGDPIPNFLTVSTACALLLFNLNRFAPQPYFNGPSFLLWAVAVPAAVLLMWQYYSTRDRRPKPEGAEEGEEMLEETEETEV